MSKCRNYVLLVPQFEEQAELFALAADKNLLSGMLPDMPLVRELQVSNSLAVAREGGYLTLWFDTENESSLGLFRYFRGECWGIKAHFLSDRVWGSYENGRLTAVEYSDPSEIPASVLAIFPEEDEDALDEAA